MNTELIWADPATSVAHRLHAPDRHWTETNCYVDVWIEVLHFLGLDPSAAGAFALSTDFEGDQWTFFKYPPEDLRALYGVEIAEMNVWRPIIDHVEEQLDFGRLLTVEVDSFYLPDTQGSSYGREHVKTTIVPLSMDRRAARLDYFHNAGRHTLSGSDFDGLFRPDVDNAAWLPPYVELVRLERLHRDEGSLVSTAIGLAREHLARRPVDNPIARMGVRIAADVDWLRSGDDKTFHSYAFGTCRQCGSSAEIAADFVGWLDVRDGGGLRRAQESFATVAEQAKVLQFNLARGARGRRCDLEGPIETMSAAWDRAMTVLSDRYGD